MKNGYAPAPKGEALSLNFDLPRFLPENRFTLFGKLEL
jgi:hypothetical protein